MFVLYYGWLVGLLVFNATYNNISVISWMSQVIDKLYHIMLYRVHPAMSSQC